MSDKDKSAAAVFKAQTTVAVLPLGQVEEPELEYIACVLRNFFSLQTQHLPAVMVPKEFYSSKRKQYDADHLLSFVRSHQPESASRIIGVFNQNMFVENDKRVFGYASLKNGAMVYSTKRLHKGCLDIRQKQRRSFWLILHEMGHVFGFQHCEFKNCVMSGEKVNLGQLDNLSPEYCSGCLEKITFKVTQILLSAT